MLTEKEQLWIDITICYNEKFGYNFNRDATRPNLNKEMSEETRLKISDARKGVRLSKEAVDRMKIRFKGEGNPFYGKSHSEETKNKISEKRNGKKITESQFNGLKLGRGNVYHTEDTYRKLREVNSGEGSGSAKLKECEVVELLYKLKSKINTQRELSKEYNISETQIFRIKNGER